MLEPLWQAGDQIGIQVIAKTAYSLIIMEKVSLETEGGLIGDFRLERITSRYIISKAVSVTVPTVV